MAKLPSSRSRIVVPAGAAVAALTTGWTGLASSGAQAIAILAGLASVASVGLHRREWWSWLRETQREGRLFVLIGMLISAAAFVVFFTLWMREPAAKIVAKEEPKTAENLSPGKAVSTLPSSDLSGSQSPESNSSTSPARHTPRHELDPAPATEEPSKREFYRGHLQKFFAAGSTLHQRLTDAPTDESFNALRTDAALWFGETQGWICKNMGDPAWARFTQRGVTNVEYNWPGEHASEVADFRRKILRGLHVYLENLSTLITTGDWDSSGPISTTICGDGSAA